MAEKGIDVNAEHPKRGIGQHGETAHVVVTMGYGDICPVFRGRRSMIINPGTVDVAVLEPIPTDDWTVNGLEARVAEVRQKFVDTLDDWPKPGEVP
jgi:hypothetical protein